MQAFAVRAVCGSKVLLDRTRALNGKFDIGNGSLFLGGFDTQIGERDGRPQSLNAIKLGDGTIAECTRPDQDGARHRVEGDIRSQ